MPQWFGNALSLVGIGNGGPAIPMFLRAVEEISDKSPVP
jgi:hypothetical protein